MSLAPLRVAAESWVVRHHDGRLATNSLVITGAQPALLDTGCWTQRQEWLSAVWSLVEPAAVRWVVLSHADADHAGNLAEVLAACPHARVAASVPTFARLSSTREIAPERQVTLGP